MKTKMLAIVLIFAIFMAACTRNVAEPKILPAEKPAIQGDTELAPEPVREQAYAPEINPSDFSPEINNRFFD
ncbi:MAG: hypothetical protein HGA85_06200, partial [Nanoarchaeota archaeon]|nr:hypothetical protein [Nanoarchaeota archaeon]